MDITLAEDHFQAWYGVSEVANNDLLMKLYMEAENNEYAEDMLEHWDEASLSYEIRVVEDEEALLEKREVCICPNCLALLNVFFFFKFAGCFHLKLEV